MNYIEPFTVGDYLFVEVLSTTAPFIIHRTIDLSENQFQFFKCFKNVNPDLATRKNFVVDLEAEARVLRSLQLPGVPLYCDYGTVQSQSYLVYEYIWGRSLLQVMRELKKHNRMLSVAYSLHIMSEVCRCLKHVHAQRNVDFPGGMLHRLLSPRNIIISFSGKVHVVGFGHPGPTLDNKNISDFDFRNISYLSPEQVTGQEVGATSDLFSAGAVLYELLTGVPLFLEKTPAKVLDRITRCTYMLPSRVNPQIPDDLDRFLFKTVTAYPGDRYAHAGEMEKELLQVLNSGYRDFAPSKIAKLMKWLFNGEIVEEIRHFKQLADQAGRRDRLLMKSIPRLLFDQVNASRAGEDAGSVDMGSFSFGSRPGGSRPDSIPKSGEHSKKPYSGPDLPPVGKASTVAYSLEDFKKTRMKLYPTRRSFFEEEDTMLAGETLEPRPVIIRSARAVSESVPVVEPAGTEKTELAPPLPEGTPDKAAGRKSKKKTAVMNFADHPAGKPASGAAGMSGKLDVLEESFVPDSFAAIPAVDGPQPPGLSPETPGDVAVLDTTDFRMRLIGKMLGEYTVWCGSVKVDTFVILPPQRSERNPIFQTSGG